MKKEDTRNHILDTAIDLFWRKSYHAVNMNELSRAAEVNKATVYQHFASKEELAVAGLKRAAERTEAYIYQSTFEETNDPVKRLETIYEKVFLMQSDIYKSEGKCRGCPFINLGSELATTSDAIRLAVKDAFTSFERYYAQIVGGHSGQSSSDTASAAASLMANMNGCLVAAKIENRPEAVLDGQKRALQLLNV